MTSYYVDEQKYLCRTRNPIAKLKEDKNAGQFIHITGSVSGVTVRPEVRWTTFCEKQFRENGANGVWLEQISCAPDGNLNFVNGLKGCTRLLLEGDGKIDLSPLTGNAYLEDLQLSPSAQISNFDLASLSNLRRCQIPVCPELMSFLNCRQLISLWLNGGRYDNVLKLDSLLAVEEFICSGVSKLTGVVFYPKTRLRSLKLLSLKNFQSIGPQKAITEDLRVVELSKVPRMKIEWLRQAHKVDCIALRQGEIPSINFLRGLRHLQVLDLFGSKVKDGDLSFRDSLRGELDSELWSSKR